MEKISGFIFDLHPPHFTFCNTVPATPGVVLPENRSVPFKLVAAKGDYALVYRRGFTYGGARTHATYYILHIESRSGVPYGTEVEHMEGGRSWRQVKERFDQLAKEKGLTHVK